MVMKIPLVRALLFFIGTLVHSWAWSQTVSGKLSAAYKVFAESPQLRNAISSLYIIDAKTGQVVLDRNAEVGLAPASTMKIITSVSAYELLGKDFQYQTKLSYYKQDKATSLIILPSGDPTLGSWRWPFTKEESVVKGVIRAIKKAGIKSVDKITINNEGWEEEAIPDGWIWQDIGNYYGAGASKLNWRENQFDIILKSGKQIGDPVIIVKTIPQLSGYALKSELKSAAVGTGDKAYIYFPLNGVAGIIRGTIPVNENSFKISGALPIAAHQLIFTLGDSLSKAGIISPKKALVATIAKTDLGKYTVFHTINSPPLDSLIFWFNRKSINLYGEALVKSLAYKNKGIASTQLGVDLIKNYWQAKGIPKAELNMVDGSGLSPLNRITTHAQVSVLQHAQKQAWFLGFYKALPLYNNMKMKSGTIRDVKGFCGYHRSKDGKEYIFSFLVNNYNGSAPALVQKMYKVLDELK